MKEILSWSGEAQPALPRAPGNIPNIPTSLLRDYLHGFLDVGTVMKEIAKDEELRRRVA